MQPFYQGSAFAAKTYGEMINLMYRGSDFRPLPPYSLDMTKFGGEFDEGTYYILSLTGTTMSIRSGSDITTFTVSVSNYPKLIYVGAFVMDPSLQSVWLYALVQLSLSAPFMGSHGVV